MILTDIHTL